MEQIVATLNQSLINLAVVAITALSGIAGAYLLRLRKKAESEIKSIKDDDTQTYLNTIGDRIYDLMCRCVDQTEVILVKQLKKASGKKLSEEEQKMATTEAIKLFKELANDAMKQVLEVITDDTEKYLETLIRSIVLEKKSELLKSGVNPDATTGAVPVENALLNS